MSAVKLYTDAVDVYDRVHYSHGEDMDEVGAILSWFRRPGARILDLGCGTGVHAAAFAARGHRVTGVDNSEQAIAAAGKRTSGMEGVSFHLMDLDTDSLAGFDIQDLVISLGNTMSHLGRGRLVTLFSEVRRLLAPGGVFVFNTIYWAQPFGGSVVERDPAGEMNVVWERKLDEETGTVRLTGHFLKESYTEDFLVSCYKVPEVVNLLKVAGFSGVRWSDGLDFRGRTLKGVNTVFYRARMPGGPLRRA